MPNTARQRGRATLKLPGRSRTPCARRRVAVARRGREAPCRHRPPGVRHPHPGRIRAQVAVEQAQFRRLSQQHDFSTWNPAHRRDRKIIQPLGPCETPRSPDSASPHSGSLHE